MASRSFVRGVTMLARGEAGIVPNTARYRKIQELQNTFSCDDGRLVWQKLGRDKVLYLFTMGVMVCGFVPSLSTLWKMSFPKKAE